MNKTFLLGRIVKDLEIQQVGGYSKCEFTIAVTRKMKNKSGEYDTDFIGCIAWGKTAEVIVKYFKKGERILVEGRIETGSYEKNGVKVYTTKIVVESIDFIENKNSNVGNTQQANNGNYEQNKEQFKSQEKSNPFEGMDYEVSNDNLPF